MKLNSVLSLAVFASAASAKWVCTTNAAALTISDEVARAAIQNGGTDTNTKSRFPHGFAGMTGNGSPGKEDLPTFSHEGWKIWWYGADNRCNADQPDDPNESNLLEFPVFENGKAFNKDAKRGDGVNTPVRVVYLREDQTFCGVMTHVLMDSEGAGAGDFRACDDV